MQAPVTSERNGGILEVTINRPKANAIDAATSRQMGEIFRDFRDDPDLRVAIVTAAGDKFFSAGWDLKAASAGEPAESDYGVGGFGGLQELPNLNKPVIAAVNGMAVGGGFEIMISADLIIAAEMLLTGRWMDTAEASHWGLINEVLPADQVLPRARELAALLAGGPPLIFAAIKDVLRRTENLQEQQSFSLLNALHSVQRVYSSEDMLEGTTAFAEKRKPVWKGR
jgi:crotonobetainyl-CoA hydratase